MAPPYSPTPKLILVGLKRRATRAWETICRIPETSVSSQVVECLLWVKGWTRLKSGRGLLIREANCAVSPHSSLERTGRGRLTGNEGPDAGGIPAKGDH